MAKSKLKVKRARSMRAANRWMAPAPIMTETITWHPVRKARPMLSAAEDDPGAFGIAVLIWPPAAEDGYSDTRLAYYGKRLTDEPNFYLYGRVLHAVTHWAYAPRGPKL